MVLNTPKAGYVSTQQRPLSRNMYIGSKFLTNQKLVRKRLQNSEQKIRFSSLFQVELLSPWEQLWIGQIKFGIQFSLILVELCSSPRYLGHRKGGYFGGLNIGLNRGTLWYEGFYIYGIAPKMVGHFKIDTKWTWSLHIPTD